VPKQSTWHNISQLVRAFTVLLATHKLNLKSVNLQFCDESPSRTDAVCFSYRSIVMVLAVHRDDTSSRTDVKCLSYQPIFHENA
jgi:hypothetical protein